jgi:hypothetical protein
VSAARTKGAPRIYGFLVIFPKPIKHMLILQLYRLDLLLARERSVVADHDFLFDALHFGLFVIARVEFVG